ncbi:hypothetical protein Tco_0125956, partial [Tanacetum coccineum]
VTQNENNISRVDKRIGYGNASRHHFRSGQAFGAATLAPPYRNLLPLPLTFI